MQTRIISERLYAASICERCFANKDVNEMASIFSKTMSHVLSNYIPHETIIWINIKAKKVIQEKSNS